MTANIYQIPKIDRPFDVQIALPGSKSIALRQLAMAAISHGVTRIVGIPPCDDTEAMLECIQTLGAEVRHEADHVCVAGPINYTRDVTLDARMSGASTRLLIGLAALRRGSTTIDGHPSLRARTNAPLFDVLAAHGCTVNSDHGKLPVVIKGPITPPDRLTIDGALSSQYVTALLLIAPVIATSSEQVIQISGTLVSRPYVDITLNEMAKRGIAAHWQDQQTLIVRKGEYAPGKVEVEGDATAASYFAALATLHGAKVTLTNLGANTCQGDYAFFEVMERLGAEVTRAQHNTTIIGPAELKSLGAIDMCEMPDAALTLIALAPLLPSPTTITGVSSLHHKECDRLECPAKEFQAIGVAAKTTYDSITVQPTTASKLAAHTMATYHDHRMAMAFSIIGSVTGLLSVDDKSVVNKTYPGYWRDYLRLVDNVQEINT